MSLYIESLKHPPTSHMTRGSPLSEENNNSKICIFCYVKIGLYIEISNREEAWLIFISVCIITVRHMNCHHTAGEEGKNKRGYFFFGRGKGGIFCFALVLQWANYFKINILMWGKKPKNKFSILWWKQSFNPLPYEGNGGNINSHCPLRVIYSWNRIASASKIAFKSEQH